MNSAPKMKVPATKPSFSEADIADILPKFARILRGEGFLSMGKYASEFEEKFASYIGTKYGVASNSGTSALELIFRAIGIEGREVIMPSNTFVATANAIINAGGIPVFADCDDQMCLSYSDVVSRITDKCAGVCHVHIGGLVTPDALRLAEYCRERGLHFVEDACQAHGTSIDGEMAGSLGTAGAFSFFSTKVMTTGEGGMVTTNQYSLVEKMKSLREFGKVKTGIYINYYQMFGYNWRMPEVAALMGLRQLEGIDSNLAKRRRVAAIYDSALAGLKGIRILRPADPSCNNYFKYIVVLDNHLDRETVHRKLEAAGISPSGYVYECPLHKMPVFPADNATTLPITEQLCASHVCLPIFPDLTDEQAIYVASSLREIVS